MRILILTHPRSGGFSLLAWISKELNFEAFHEPFLNPKHTRTHYNALISPRVVVKEDISHLVSVGLDVKDFVRSFDRVIFHLREDHRAAAISLVRQLEVGESHVVYPMNAIWIAARETQISKRTKDLMGIHSAILYQAVTSPTPSIQTTYEGIYDSGDDITKICQFLDISDPQWLDMIHPARRLQNGTPMPPPVRKAKLL
jgi:hypothetical protein